MKNYWDLTEKQRSQLADYEVDAFASAELMLRGVLRVPALELLPVIEPLIERRTYYQIGQHGGLVFETEAAAREALKAGAREIRYAYEGGYAVVDKAPEITIVDLPSEAQSSLHRVALKAASDAKESNRKATEQHQNDVHAADGALAEMKADWRCCQAKARLHARVLATFDEYKDIAIGDSAVAAAFLSKVFPDDTIREAFIWFERVRPTADAAALANVRRGPSSSSSSAAAEDEVAF